MSAVDVLVVGAGPAGSATARALARAGASVQLCEAGVLPRHRLCGEFVSPEAVSDVAGLGLDWSTSGAVRLAAARVAGGGTWAETPLEAFALERRRLDAWLAEAAVAAGARLRTETRVAALTGDAQRGWVAILTGRGTERVRARFVVGAFGAQSIALRSARRAAGGRVAIKTHVLGASMPARVELHAFPGGYVGLAPVGAERINVCVVTRTAGVHRGGGAAGALADLVARAPAAQARIAAGHEDPAARRAASGLHFGNVQPVWGDVLLVGDAASLPHPLAGDGIAMALRAGRLAAAHVLAALDGRLPSCDLATVYARAWRREFAPRLRWDAPLHSVLEHPVLAAPVLRLLRRWPRGLAALVERTRGAQVAPSLQEVRT